jgi:hypothetical protein
MRLRSKFHARASAAAGVIVGISTFAAISLLGQQGSLGNTNPNLNPGTACDSVGMALARAYGRDAALAASYLVPASAVAAWQERPSDPSAPHVGTSGWRAHPPSEKVSVCYYDGGFDNLAAPGGPPAGGAPAPQIVVDRVLILVGQDGQPALYRAGPRSGVPIEDPAVR